MSSINAFHESLPYIDNEPTPAERAAAEALIATEPALQTKPSPPSQKEPSFSPLVILELERVAAKQPLTAIDLSRYEAQEPLPTTAAKKPSDRTALQDALRKAYTSYSYLDVRQQNLELLDKWGKNAWLVGNWQLENELKSLERELGETKKNIDILNLARKRQQEEVAAEMKGLEENWKRGVGRVLETEIAAEGLRREVLDEMRIN